MGFKPPLCIDSDPELLDRERREDLGQNKSFAYDAEEWPYPRPMADALVFLQFRQRQSSHQAEADPEDISAKGLPISCGHVRITSVHGENEA